MKSSKVKRNFLDHKEKSNISQNSIKFYQKVTKKYNYIIKQVKSSNLGNKTTILNTQDKYDKYSLSNKENNSSLFNSQRLSSSNNYRNSTNDNTRKKGISKEKPNVSLIKKFQMKFTTLYNINNNNNSISQSTDFNKFSCLINTKNSKLNRIKVNRAFSPKLDKNKNGNNSNIVNNNRTSKNKIIKKSKEKDKEKEKNKEIKMQRLQNSISSVSLNSYKNCNYIESNSIKLINIKVNVDKIKIIQKWWKYIYKIILLQKNIKSFIVQKKCKPKLKFVQFIKCILKINFNYFNNCITECYIKYLRYFLKKWNEITYKRIILKRILIGIKSSKNRRQILSMSNSNYFGLNNDNISTIIINDSKNIFNNSTFYQDNKILSPCNANMKVNKPLNFQINIKKRKNITCNIYNNAKKNIFDKSLNQSKQKNQSKENSSKMHISNFSDSSSTNINKIPLKKNNKTIGVDNKDKLIKNYLYQNIKEYYNINEITISPTFSSNNFYTKNSKFNRQKRKNLKIDIIQNNKNNFNKSKKLKKIPINYNFKKAKTKNNEFKNNSTEKNLHIKTFGIMNNHNKILQNMPTSPGAFSYRVERRNNNRSLEFNNNDIHIVLLLLKVKKCFLYWKNIMFKNSIIKKLRLISKIKHIFYIYKFIYIKIFFAKIFYSLYKKDFCLNIINYNSKLLKIYYNKLKEISKIKKVNYFDTRNLPKTKTDKTCKMKYLEKKNSKLNMNNKKEKTDELYNSTQFNKKLSKLNSIDKNKVKNNNNIIIINNNINNNCQQLIKDINKNKEINKRANYNQYNSSMIEIQTLTDSSFSCGYGNQSEKSLNSVFSNNLIYKKKGNLDSNNNDINNNNSEKNKSSQLYSIINLMEKINIKNKLKKYVNMWKSKIKHKKSINYIDEKIIHFPKSPQQSTNTFENKNNYNNAINNSNIFNYYKNNDLIINTVFTENNANNPKNLFYSTIVRDTMTPCNKYFFFTECNNDSYNTNNYSRQTESHPHIIYKKKVLPLSGMKNSEKSRCYNNNSMIFNYSYNKYEKYSKNNAYFDNNSLNNYIFGGNDIKNFYTSNNFFNKRNYYDLNNINLNLNNILPEDKYGIKKMNKIEEREISFSPRLSKNSMPNINMPFSNNKDNNLKQIKVDNIYGVANNTNITNNFYNFPIKESVIKESNSPKLMNHSQSQGFKKSFGNFI